MPEGSAEIHKRVAALTTPTSVVKPIADKFTGKLACHRFMIPFDVQTPIADKLNPKLVNIKVDAHMAHVSCIGEKCALWNADRKECWDVSEKRSHGLIADVLERMDGFQRLHTQES